MISTIHMTQTMWRALISCHQVSAPRWDVLSNDQKKVRIHLGCAFRVLSTYAFIGACSYIPGSLQRQISPYFTARVKASHKTAKTYTSRRQIPRFLECKTPHKVGKEERNNRKKTSKNAYERRVVEWLEVTVGSMRQQPA